MVKCDPWGSDPFASAMPSHSSTLLTGGKDKFAY